jgi:membrane-associated protease RseP (regulator of RpoE activity)
MTMPRGDIPIGPPDFDFDRSTSSGPIRAEIVAEPRPFPIWPVILFLATCYTTYSVGEMTFGQDFQYAGFLYSVPLLTILVCHEFGHYLQARRYHVPASLPYFIPVPLPPLGTMGAVIGMRGNSWNRKELFDIGITGPLAGLVPTLIFCVIGLQLSMVVDRPPPGTEASGHAIGAPLLFRYLVELILGPLPPDKTIALAPLAYAGWVGMFITALNLIPISQLDGGHVLYALLRRKAHIVASLLLTAAIVAVLVTQNYQWSLMLFLLVLIGPNHPPTADDSVALGTPRIILGWLTLAFVIIGFTPTPFM